MMRSANYECRNYFCGNIWQSYFEFMLESELSMVLSRRTFFILLILLVDVSAQAFKCLHKCDKQEKNNLRKTTCMLTCPTEELEECRKRCMDKGWQYLLQFPTACLSL
ncbi:unnamed protein product [Cylicocyclus nassatus]|uniref:Uncharacterized protein n=1 Tax=Cylicocyclus nassatus TaxID=53992 RepID=A0AA36GWQ0_CYLNA|nr:unnamed protein product [Cylicocyclus nassatus]